MTFDPYRKWLGIPRDKRPPTHYQLLGISPDETDADAINATVLQRTAFVRHYQTGPHADEANQILNEIAEAANTLSDPVKRRRYDATLYRLHRAQLSGMARPADGPNAGLAHALFMPIRLILWIFELDRDHTDTKTGPSVFTRPFCTAAVLTFGVLMMVGTLWFPWAKLAKEGKTEPNRLSRDTKPAV